MPTGVEASDHSVHFTVPPGLMPDPRFDGRAAKLEVHRVRPVYAHGRCPSVPNRAAVLVHGRTQPGPAAFDLRHPAPEGGELSVQKALARAGIDTFAPSLLGYGRSTRFDDGLKDPGNARLRPYAADDTCAFTEGCDRTHVPVFPLDQQGSLLLTNPLGGQRRAHTSKVRFARVDTFVRDIRQVVDDAIALAQPANGKVTLIGYSAGGQHVARALYAANPILPDSARFIAKIDRAVFASSIFGTPTEETPPPAGFATFPLHLTTPASFASTWQMPAGRDSACTGHVVPGSPERLGAQIMELETEARQWGGTDPARPTGLATSPTFSSYGWNTAVAGTLTMPTLVIHGQEDLTAPPANAPGIYDSLRVPNKVLVQVACASHALLYEGCTASRCIPASGSPYGAAPGQPWAGPHATLKAALVEWITKGTFNGAASGRFGVDESGVARPSVP
jgi:pimeloyl-ACP methyl ester carboxylesterase